MPAVTRYLRAQYYDTPVPAQDFLRYHRSEQEIGGLFATETSHPPRFDIPRHAHDLPSFYVVLEGSLTEFYDRRRRDLGAASVVFTPAGEIHRNRFHDGGGRCFLVELSPRWVARLEDVGFSPEGSFEAHGGELTWLTARLYKEFRDVDTVSPLACEGLVLEVLAAFCRRSDRAPARYLPGWLRATRDLVRDRYSETMSLDEIAREVGIHPVHLARTFRRRFRCSLGEYQRRLRVEHASHELLQTRRPLAEIALAVGFADQAHFSRVFKARMGFSPGRFRATFGRS